MELDPLITAIATWRTDATRCEVDVLVDVCAHQF